MITRTQFDHERLDVYQLQLSFIAWLAELDQELRNAKPRRVAEALDQLDRASLSVLLNIAEGNGRRPSQQRIRFLDDARGSATECAACLDALVAKRAVDPMRIGAGKTTLIRVVSILCVLIDRFAPESGDNEAASTSGSRIRRTTNRA